MRETAETHDSPTQQHIPAYKMTVMAAVTLRVGEHVLHNRSLRRRSRKYGSPRRQPEELCPNISLVP